MIYQSNFKPAWWLRNRHLQTIVPMLSRAREKIQTTEEILELPDGDFVELAWTEKPKPHESKPIILIFHGLEGSVSSHYIKGILKAIKQQAWIGLLMHFRNCGKQRNRKPHSYHSGATGDASYLITYLSKKYPNATLAAIGYSLGGNMLTKFLGENETSLLKTSVVISAPLDLSACSQKINRGFSKIYQQYLLRSLLNQVKQKIKKGQITQLSENTLHNIKTMRDFDHRVTAPLNNFDSAEDYYAKCSGQNFLKNISVPTLFIQAKDDPFLGEDMFLAFDTFPQNIFFEVSSHGGHVGFISGYNPFQPIYWLEKRVVDFLKLTMPG